MKSLDDVIQAAGNPVDLLRNAQAGPNVYPGVPPEYTNWRDETQAWQKACVLFNLSFHMADLYVEGPDATKLLSSLAINTFKNVSPGRAKQFVPCSYDGHVIGDVILFNSAPNKYVLVGRIPALNWITYHAQAGKYDVKLELDERSAARKDPFGRKQYRFQIQGPNAMKAMEKVLGGKVPEVKFFHVTTMTIAGKQVTALRHGMAGQPGFELVGPYAEGDAVRDAIFKAGQEFGLRLVGGRAYSANTLESGWIPSPLPAVYSGDKMKPYRQWLNEDSYEARASIGGSFVSKKIEDYYLTPWDMGYGSFIDFEHEFIGREALQKLAKGQHRKESDARPRERRRPQGDQQPAAEVGARQVLGIPVGRLLDASLRQGARRWQASRHLDLGWLQRQRRQDADHRHPGCGACRARHRSDLRLGRGKRRHEETDGRAARADGDPRHRQPGALRRNGAQGLRRRQGLARENSGVKAPFRADHVGSLLRPAVLHELREASSEKLKDAEDQAIREVVKLQEGIGLPSITDGEFRRDWWHIDFLGGFGGIELRREGKRPVAGFTHADHKPPMMVLTGKLRRTKPSMLSHFQFLKSVVTKGTPKFTMPVPGHAARAGRSHLDPQGVSGRSRILVRPRAVLSRGDRRPLQGRVSLPATRRYDDRHVRRSEGTGAVPQGRRRSEEGRRALRAGGERGDPRRARRHDGRDPHLPRQLQEHLAGERQLRLRRRDRVLHAGRRRILPRVRR
jgi:syringate O-demethylase